MRNLSLTFFLAILLHLVVGVDVANALPKCTDPTYRHNCVDTHTDSNGNKYVGEWKNNKKHGQGTYSYSWGITRPKKFKIDEYVGAFKDGKRHGQGTFTYSNGNKYVGEWKDNKKHGQGTLYCSSNRTLDRMSCFGNRVKKGIWDEGLFNYRLFRNPQSQPKKIAK